MKWIFALCIFGCPIHSGLCNSKDAVKKPPTQPDPVVLEEQDRHDHNQTLVRMQGIRAAVAKMSLTDIGYYKFAAKPNLSDLGLKTEQEHKFFKICIDVRYQHNKDYFDGAGDGRVVAFVDKEDEISQPGSTGINYAVELTPTN